MAIAPAFNDFPSEAAFIQGFLIPLLQRLGFSLVVNYHGKTEFGKDLIFAEVDRFGHIRYHALQAKLKPSISLNGIEDLIRDCRQAFENPFTHPQTGTTERISSFYAVTGGTIGPEAAQHYFNTLLKHCGSNARLLQAKDLLALDRWAVSSHRDNVTSLLAGLLLELNYNEVHVLPLVIGSMRNLLEGTGAWELWRLRTDAMSSYLRQPVMPSALNVDMILNYWHLCVLCNKEADLVGQGIFSPENRKQLTQQTINHLEDVRTHGLLIRSSVAKALQTLSPLLGDSGGPGAA